MTLDLTWANIIKIHPLCIERKLQAIDKQRVHEAERCKCWGAGRGGGEDLKVHLRWSLNQITTYPGVNYHDNYETPLVSILTLNFTISGDKNRGERLTLGDIYSAAFFSQTRLVSLFPPLAKGLLFPRVFIPCASISVWCLGLLHNRHPLQPVASRWLYLSHRHWFSLTTALSSPADRGVDAIYGSQSHEMLPIWEAQILNGVSPLPSPGCAKPCSGCHAGSVIRTMVFISSDLMKCAEEVMSGLILGGRVFSATWVYI